MSLVSIPISRNQNINTPANPIFVREGNTDNISEITFSQDLSIAPLAFTTILAAPFILNYVSLIVPTGSLQTFIIGLDAIAGSAFDTELMKRKQAYDFFFFEPPKDTRYKSGNEITVALTNIGTPAIIVSGVISVIGI